MSPETAPPPGFDFEDLYRGLYRNAFGVPLRCVPWDIGGPQPAVIDLERAGRFTGRVLDAGCGFGDNAIFLARKGYQLTGFDCAPTAIETARRRAAGQGVPAAFVVAAAPDLGALDAPYDSVLDCALLHCLGTQQRKAYLAAVARLCRRGAWLNLLCYAHPVPEGLPVPPGLSRRELKDALGDQWEITSVETAPYTTSFPQDVIPAYFAQTGRAPRSMPSGLGVDDEGRLKAPMWQVLAECR